VRRVPIGHITNGVHVASWLSMDMARFFNRHLGEGWGQRMCYPETWRAVGEIKDEELWEQHQIMKVHLFDYVQRCINRQRQRRGEPVGPDQPASLRLNLAALTIGFARRFATYKRAGLLLSDLDRLDALVNDPARPVQIIVAGKAHPADEPAKALLQHLFGVTCEPRFAGKIVFIEDYDINVCRHLVQGVDVWLNTPRRPNEACGTSGQKVLLNGGLNLSILDGWWAEAYDGANGFAIGCGGEDADPQRQDQKDLSLLFEALEKQVIPLYYARDHNDIPRAWVAMVKHAIRSLAWRYNADRMVMDYAQNAYLPAVGGCSALPCSTHVQGGPLP
jgi:starch phosphorylase